MKSNITNAIIPDISLLKHTFKTSIEEFFSPKLLPIMSISFLLVTLSLTVTGKKLNGPPLCYSSCSTCLSSWDSSVVLDTLMFTPQVLKDLEFNANINFGSISGDNAGSVDGLKANEANILSNSLSEADSLNMDRLVDPNSPNSLSIDPSRIGCGFMNGKEMLGYYTMAQTSFLQFMAVIVAMSVCLAWRVAEEELVERQEAVNWLKKQDVAAYDMRDNIIAKYGLPGSSIRPEGSSNRVDTRISMLTSSSSCRQCSLGILRCRRRVDLHVTWMA